MLHHKSGYWIVQVNIRIIKCSFTENKILEKKKKYRIVKNRILHASPNVKKYVFLAVFFASTKNQKKNQNFSGENTERTKKIIVPKFEGSC